jgi:dihydroorotate dehydrogenase (NAD+) catalytic subunit
MSIELAPNHKRSLTLTNPLILSSASAVDARVGAIVTLPLTLHARGGAPLPRVVEIPGGFLMRTGAANPGLEKMLRDSRRAWSQSRVPIIIALAAPGARDWPAIAARLERVDGVGGIELHLNPALDAVDTIRTTRAATELPILAKLDLENAVAIAGDCAAAGANALVIGRAPRGMAMVEGRPWYGRLFAPSSKPLALRAVAEIAALKLDAPLVACGGVHSTGDVREFLAAGACAVEIDSAAWIAPSLVARIAAESMNGPQTNADEDR